MTQNPPFNDGNAKQKGTERRRPGPFGPAWALLPKDQQPLVLEGSTPASGAIEHMVDNGFSQIRVLPASLQNLVSRLTGDLAEESAGERAYAAALPMARASV